jgi:hypothetical protein
LIEHFHPEDTPLHFQMVSRILKKGGQYIFRTPQITAGPHDISKYFSDVPEGFHLKEWTYTEIRPILEEAGFTKISARLMLKRRIFPVPYWYFTGWEALLGRFHHTQVRGLASTVIREINIIAKK